MSNGASFETNHLTRLGMMVLREAVIFIILFTPIGHGEFKFSSCRNRMKDLFLITFTTFFSSQNVLSVFPPRQAQICILDFDLHKSVSSSWNSDKLLVITPIFAILYPNLRILRALGISAPLGKPGKVDTHAAFGALHAIQLRFVSFLPVITRFPVQL